MTLLTLVLLPGAPPAAVPSFAVERKISSLTYYAAPNLTRGKRKWRHSPLRLICTAVSVRLQFYLYWCQAKGGFSQENILSDQKLAKSKSNAARCEAGDRFSISYKLAVETNIHSCRLLETYCLG